MSVGITDLAHSIRKNTASSAAPIPLSRGQQLVAAALGHKSLASFQAAQAAELEPQDFHGLAHVVPDLDLLSARAQELGISAQGAQLRALVETAFKERLPRTRIHRSFDSLAGSFHDKMQSSVSNDNLVSSELANANHDGIEEVYIETELEPDKADIGEPVVVSIPVQVTLGIDTERPYSGHKVSVELDVTMQRCGRRCFDELDIEVLSAALDYDWGGSDDDVPLNRSLAQALAEVLSISVADAEELVDVEPLELTGQSGDMTYGFLFDFTNYASPELATKLLKQHGSLKLEVGPSFFEGVQTPD